VTTLLTGILLGAASWSLVSNWLASVFGWPTVIVGMLLLALLCIYLLATAPDEAEA
jgi:sugar phosphate permease